MVRVQSGTLPYVQLKELLKINKIRINKSTLFNEGTNWNLEMLVFVEGGKPENPEKNPLSKDQNQQQTQPTYDVESENRTRVTLVGGKCSHYCAIPASPEKCIQNVNEVLYSRFLKCTFEEI